MFTRYRTQGFILEKTDAGEADRLFTVYTKDFGRLELIARSVRKIQSKLRAGLEIFYLSEIEFIQGKIQKTLTDAVLIDGFKNLRKDLVRLFIARRISEVFNGLIKGQEPDEKLWHLLSEVFKALDDKNLKTEACNLLYHYFVWNFLSLLGYRPDLYHCSLCRERLMPDGIYLSLKEKSLICGRCQKKTGQEKLLVFPADTVKIIRVLLKKDWALAKRLKIKDKDFASLKIISDHYLRQIE